MAFLEITLEVASGGRDFHLHLKLTSGKDCKPSSSGTSSITSVLNANVGATDGSPLLGI